MSLKKSKPADYPRVSVIVACRNESENIERCINSLAKTEYPSELMEIILVNDNSTDDTYEKMIIASKGNPVFKIINTNVNQSQNLKGKANALDTAIKICTGDYIVSTDADCEVGPYWVRETVRYFTENTAMVCGFTKIKSEKGIFSKLQNLDWMYLLSLASASSGLNMILSCLGNNLSYSKKAYSEIGGYAGINFSVTEDLALMRKLNSDKRFKVIYPVNKNCIAETFPCRSISELMSQKRRWFRGGTGINALGYLMGFELFSVNILLLTGYLFLDIKIYLLLIVLKTLSELLLISKVLHTFKLQYLYKYYIFFILYFAGYGLFLPLSFLTGKKIKWKGREF
ncbi:MAG TPA: glycosyltransferase [Ignavibacteria bacterium]|nr:glycosyltransferase [Ignavibacteria bacterium]HMR40127.1 glycosyltransferase [Ignavibacteria bacterium]